MNRNIDRLLAVATIVSILTVGCTWEQLLNQQKPKLGKLKPVNYSARGIKLVHPEGWSVAQERLENGDQYLTLEDRYSSIVILNVAASGEYFDLEESAASSHAEMKKNVPIVGMSEPVKANTSKDIASKNYEGRRYLFDISIAGVRVPHITDYFVAEIGGRSVFVTLQAPAEDWPGAEQEFQMILDSVAIGSKGK